MKMNYNIIILVISVLGIGIFTLFYNKGEYEEAFEDPKINEIKQNLLKLDPVVAGRLNIKSGNKSYTENKKNMFLCLKDGSGKYYPDNMLNYVAIHELAHAKSKQVDTKHKGKEFHDNFEYYLEEAEKKGIYDPSKGLVYDYCGVTPNTK